MSEASIPAEEFERVRRRSCRMMAAAIMRAMAENDASFAFIARRVGAPERSVRHWIVRLANGDGRGMMIDRVSDIFLAMNAELQYSIGFPLPERSDAAPPEDIP